MSDVQQQLVAYARQIAVYKGYDKLVNGLQPAQDLEGKYEHEWLEFHEKQVRNAPLTEQLHEAADVLYYACQLEQQTGQSLAATTLKLLVNTGMRQDRVIAAALAKYEYRASRPNSKDEQHELE
ncbi:MAG TPA: hypothetical protein VH593_07090, partial [Ktedonobacteraceae bacterium]